MDAHSIRLRFTRWLQLVSDHVAEKFVEELRGSEMHPQPRRDCHHRLVVGVDHPGPERQRNYAVSVCGFGNRVNVLNRHASIQDQLALRAHRQASLSHQTIPLLRNPDLSILNARTQGVQS